MTGEGAKRPNERRRLKAERKHLTGGTRLIYTQLIF